MGAYYNEFDPRAAAWLRELIKRKLIADGEVDERSILDVHAEDLRGFTQCHFFAGIGGWSYALRLAEWPDTQPVWTGSPPCQPFSAAGQQKGKEDERHLAPHFADLVAAGRPPFVFGEQVASSAVFGKVAKRAKKDTDKEPDWAWIDDLSDRLEGSHYAVGATDIPAAGVGAPHIRQRTFFGAVDLERLDNTTSPRCVAAGLGTEGEARDKTRLRGSELGCADDRLADADIIGQSGQREVGRSGNSTPYPDREKHRVVKDGFGCTKRTSQTNGFWRDADWLFCRDGKWRPVEPASQRMANGLSLCLGSMRGTCVDEKEGPLNAEEAIRLGGKALRVLRQTDGAEAFWLSVGGRIGFPQATFLLAVMCKYSRELGIITDSETSGSEQDGQDFLRALRERASQTSRSSQGSECSEQFTKELGDALSKLSQDSAQYRELMTSLASYTAGPLAQGVSNRVVRLRGYGNAIVPQAGAAFVKSFTEAARDAFGEQR